MSANSPTVQRRDLGARLRRYRDNAGLNGAQAAATVDRSDSWLSQLESGRVGIRAETLTVLLDTYGVTDPDERQGLIALSRGGRQRGWWSRYASVVSKTYSSYIGFEDGAAELDIWEALAVHGLLQTEEYAEIVTRAASPGDRDDAITKRVKVRLARQKRLLGNDPLRLRVVMDEAVLHRVIGGNVDVHRRQLEHLLEVARDTSRYSNVRIQFVPFTHSAYPGQAACFTVLRFPRNLPEMVYIETLTGDLYEEPPESERYTLAFDDLRAAALSDSASIELIGAVLSGLA